MYGHGGDLRTAAERFGVERKQWLDFSANINPLGPPAKLLSRLQNELTQIIHYPDPGQRDLRQALAIKLGIDPEWLLIGNGAAECMALAVQAIAPKTVGVFYPCFSEYVTLAEQFGARVTGCCGSEPEYKPGPDERNALIANVDLLFIGHPNNPTGLIYSEHELIEMAERTEQCGTYLAVDEAFLDFVAPEKMTTLLPRLNRYPHVIILRSLTKMFAIPGLRLGYAIAQPDVIERMKQKQVTWSVNQLALAAGEECLSQDDYVEKTRELIDRERAFLRDCIEQRLGWQVCPGEANFLLVRLPDTHTAAELQQSLGKKGILIRSCAMYPGLTEQHFRIAVRAREENERLLQALEQEQAKGGRAT